MNNVVRAVGALAIAATVPLIATGPASAASVPQGFNVTSYDVDTLGWDGSATASGSVVFNSAYSFSLSGKITDNCPKDGHSAFAYVEVRLTSGSTQLLYVSRDSSGCGDGVSGNMGFGKTLTSRISGVRILAIEGDQLPDGRRALNRQTGHYSYVKDNPYT